MSVYVVERHGGTRRSAWQDVYRGVDRDRAWVMYGRTAAIIGRGVVRITEDGKPLAAHHPTLTRVR